MVKMFLRRPGTLLAATAILVIVPSLLLLGNRAVRPPAAVRVQALNSEARADLIDWRHQRLVHPPAPSPTTAVVTGLPSPSVAGALPKPTARPSASRPASAPKTLPAFSHVFTIVMENEESNSIIGNPAAPYINGLAARYGLATNYYAVSHPSLPNYLALTAGSTFGITSDCTTCYLSAANIADQVEASGRTWRAYMEDMPSPCFSGGSSGNYAMKHDPFMYYNDIRTNAARCAAHVVPFTQFSTDIRSGQVANYVFITPNMCNDMHDCPVGTGDAWLRTVVPMITGSAAFQNGGALFLTWDEGASGAGCCGNSFGGRVATLVISPMAIAGYHSGIAENHFSLLRTIEDAWHLGRLGAAGSAAITPMKEYFRN